MRRRAVDWTRVLDADPRPREPVDVEAVTEELVRTVAATPRWTVLSGAGLSTESGIPDYRGPSGVRRSSDPMTFSEFSGSADGRRRYWARSHLGWRLIGDARPNAGHRAVAALQRCGRVGGVVTQNVDRLHQAAGSTDVIDLHGTLDRVVCLDCSTRSPRSELEVRLAEANPDFEQLAAEVRQVNPDGDVELDDSWVAGFRVVPCLVCGGDRLKPDVVFFGESVPKERVARAFAELDRTRALLVLGSSLSVMSGYRFVRHASRHGYPVVVVNQGATRGDAEADLLAWLPLGEALTTLAERLG
ncbi:NAD-dependent protein deacetylase [Auraticoccus sp. F435]|uniref:NAD-dependent protein deacetylase n=1 Tax=Auraticoccus cholistanensis TaxID=2656650 RepID=A0A6A9UVT3_9ACTN|nr:NAD-dependent protein deacetylase [Auraticoccus cholistanensis]MVA75742.1 NAD-dependent protein deacetylase [Auraticoccus cholistanensis]